MDQRSWPIIQLDPYIHIQTIPVKEVTITHNKRKLFPPTIIVNDFGKPFEAVVESPDENTIVIKMNTRRIFKVYIY